MASGMKGEARDRRADEPTSGASDKGNESLESFQNRAARAEQVRDEYADLLQRTQADYENYQKRVRREIIEDRRYAHADFARDLLHVIDNLKRALDAAQQAGDSGPLVQGVDLVNGQLLETFRRYGITPIGSEGEPFDPGVHEAVMQEPAMNRAPGTVVRVLEPGYRLHDRLLRPARVVVTGPS